MPQENSINLSIVIPVYNEELYIEKLFADIIKYFNNKNIEIIFVNDGSSDGSKELLQNLSNNKNYDLNLNVLNLEKNTGKGNAVRKGLSAKSQPNTAQINQASRLLNPTIGMTGFEPAAPSSRTKCATKLRHIPACQS